MMSGSFAWTGPANADRQPQATRQIRGGFDDLQFRLEKLDEFKDGDAYYAIDVQIRALKEQRRELGSKWTDLAEQESKCVADVSHVAVNGGHRAFAGRRHTRLPRSTR
jgi:hypothetical protein